MAPFKFKTPSFSLRLKLIDILEKYDLRLCDVEQYMHKGKPSTKVIIAGKNHTTGKWITKEYLVMSVDPDVIVRIINKNWY